MNNARQVVEQIRAQCASDGDGVKLLRVFGGSGPERFDPFLMLDEFGSEDASDYVGGFPPHPHRGFETVTYMLQGKMEHRDHMGNVGLINDGDVQWMTAGRGVIHSEMPRQTEGKMRGFQLWVNLPGAQKLKPAHYEDISADKIPVYSLDGCFVKAIAGQTVLEETPINGYFSVADTEALYLDIHLKAGAEITIPVEAGDTCLVYTYDGEVLLGGEKVRVSNRILSRLSAEGVLTIANASEDESRVLVLAGKPIGEPVVQHGPFVMNTASEIQQAIRDYQAGELTG
ncbi:pirin family protein [Teredinibacter haidensis]|uniref:pirin family protein n=1 Tax=Teredinibacter haidensis TaxID=2731755 RepID=UPI000948D04D|nr:pirin family protein [Teredinibacter haidensis]